MIDTVTYADSLFQLLIIVEHCCSWLFAGVGGEAVAAAVAALVVEEVWVIAVAMMMTIKDLDPATDLVVVGLAMAVVSAAEDLDHHVVVVAVVDLEGMLPMSPLVCHHFHFGIHML